MASSAMCIIFDISPTSYWQENKAGLQQNLPTFVETIIIDSYWKGTNLKQS